MRSCEWRDLGSMPWREAFALQRTLVEERKRGAIPDQLLIVEHPHVVTLGRNSDGSNILAAPEVLERAGIAVEIADRGGDVTYHGPGQIVGYTIFDLREWKRDVGEFVRAMEQALIDAIGRFGVAGERLAGLTGVWVGGGKVAAIGVHLSRWVSSHGFALNVDTDLSYFRYIVPCGLTRPVTSLRDLGCGATRAEVVAALVASFARIFDRDMHEPLTLETR